MIEILIHCQAYYTENLRIFYQVHLKPDGFCFLLF